MGRHPDDFLPLNPVTFKILIASLRGPTFGSAIVREIEQSDPGALIYPANLFRRIRDLLADGLLEECAGPEGADPRRTYVRLTRTGRSVAEAEALRIEELTALARAHDLLSDA